MIVLQASKKVSFVWLGKRGSGFSLVELMVTIAVLAVILAIAVPSFSTQIQSGRTESAAQGLARAVANARAIASQTGRRTTLTINDSLTGCANAAWAISQGSGSDLQLLGCLTKTDYTSRYQGASLGAATNTIVFLPTGIATNNQVSYVFTSGGMTKTVRINAGGTVDVL